MGRLMWLLLNLPKRIDYLCRLTND